mmetsp:Transcript_9727/g.23363  ORF Transcript_9727/g.23363 Transcript_9727/m.23363 type:complete len:201 (+) Transcript_9727:3894-4496(+)
MGLPAPRLCPFAKGHKRAILPRLDINVLRHDPFPLRAARCCWLLDGRFVILKAQQRAISPVLNLQQTLCQLDDFAPLGVRQSLCVTLIVSCSIVRSAPLALREHTCGSWALGLIHCTVSLVLAPDNGGRLPFLGFAASVGEPHLDLAGGQPKPFAKLSSHFIRRVLVYCESLLKSILLERCLELRPTGLTSRRNLSGMNT